MTAAPVAMTAAATQASKNVRMLTILFPAPELSTRFGRDQAASVS
jgi:hypothetical protein